MEGSSRSRLLISLSEYSKQLKNMDTLKEKYKEDVFIVGILFNKYLLYSFFAQHLPTTVRVQKHSSLQKYFKIYKKKY